jgi:chloramphenicol 3-O phosphotransferase
MNKVWYSVVSIVVLIAGGAFYMYTPIQKISKGHIILLNGCSASGKSSVQKALQAQSDRMYITVGIDTFFDALLPTPDLSDFAQTKTTLIQKTKGGELIRSVTLEYDKDGNPMVPLTVGPAGLRVIEGMHYATAAYAHCGNNVIIDYILYDPQWKKYLKKAFDGYTVYCVGFKLPLEVVEQREKLRSTSPVGHARSHYAHVHDGMVYDIEITDPTLTADAIAQQIVEFVEHNPVSMAFKRIKNN